MPEISVIMGILCDTNKLGMLKRAVESILNQTFGNFEFLICDDGSSKDVKQYLETLSEIDNRIVLIRNDNLIYLPGKLNACLAMAKGRYIARMDDDDYSHETRFEKQIDFMIQNPDIAFVGCQVGLYENGNIVSVRKFPMNPTVCDFYFNQPFVHPALMFRKDALISVGGYSEDKSRLFCEDYDLLLRLYAVGMKGVNMPEVLFDYTLSDSAKGKKKYKYRINEAKTRYDAFKQMGKLPRVLPYVVKPLIVGLIPFRLLCWIKKKREG